MIAKYENRTNESRLYSSRVKDDDYVNFFLTLKLFSIWKCQVKVDFTALKFKLMMTKFYFSCSLLNFSQYINVLKVID